MADLRVQRCPPLPWNIHARSIPAIASSTTETRHLAQREAVVAKCASSQQTRPTIFDDLNRWSLIWTYLTDQIASCWNHSQQRRRARRINERTGWEAGRKRGRFGTIEEVIRWKAEGYRVKLCRTELRHDWIWSRSIRGHKKTSIKEGATSRQNITV